MSKVIWIRLKEVCEKWSFFVYDYFCYGSIGMNGVLVFFFYKDIKFF